MIGIDWNAVNLFLGIVVSVGFLLGFIWATGKAIIAYRKWRHNRLVEAVAEDLRAIKAQTVPNGGSSLRDAIDRIERNTNAMGIKLDTVQSDLDKHLGFHQGLKESVRDGLRLL